MSQPTAIIDLMIFYPIQETSTGPLADSPRLPLLLKAIMASSSQRSSEKLRSL